MLINHFSGRDANGEIEQVPVLDRLPNPTPQIVAQLHQSIEEAEHVWEEKLKEVVIIARTCDKWKVGLLLNDLKKQDGRQ